MQQEAWEGARRSDAMGPLTVGAEVDLVTCIWTALRPALKALDETPQDLKTTVSNVTKARKRWGFED